MSLLQSHHRHANGHHIWSLNASALLAHPALLQQRTVGDAVLLEASLENATRAPMLLDAISFFPSPPWAAERIGDGGAAALPPPPADGGSAAAEAGPLRCAAALCGHSLLLGCCPKVEPYTACWAHHAG